MTRLSWDETWMQVAKVVSQRSRCTRDHVGAVIIDRANRIVATGYNGLPANYEGACPKEVYDGRGACYAIHAEMNAIAWCDRREREGGTIYATSTMCLPCALVIANSGVARVVAPYVPTAHENRLPKEARAVLVASGLEVVTWSLS